MMQHHKSEHKHIANWRVLSWVRSWAVHKDDVSPGCVNIFSIYSESILSVHNPTCCKNWYRCFWHTIINTQILWDPSPTVWQAADLSDCCFHTAEDTCETVPLFIILSSSPEHGDQDQSSHLSCCRSRLFPSHCVFAGLTHVIPPLLFHNRRMCCTAKSAKWTR